MVAASYHSAEPLIVARFMDLPPLRPLSELLAAARADHQRRDELFAACRSYLGVLARAQIETWLRAKVDASDLVQETLLEAHRDFERFTGQTDQQWLAWLRRILAHNAADFVRRFKGTAKRVATRERSIIQHRQQSTFLAVDPVAPGDTPSQQLILADRQLALTEAIAQLAPDHQEVVMLRNVQRLPFDEIAQRMGRSRPAVQMLWMRALKKLEETLAGRDPSWTAPQSSRGSQKP